MEISKSKDVEIIYPVHLNPNVVDTVNKYLSNKSNIHLVKPLNYPAFVWLMNKSYIILTDSGGIQEEAPSLGKPVLVMRNNTERPEGVKTGTTILVGTETKQIVKKTNDLLANKELYDSIGQLKNPYGDGEASIKILNFIKSESNIK